MPDTMTANLSDHLLRIANDPILRQSVYEHLGDYCHQCRNRLNSLKLSLFLAMRQTPDLHSGTWDAIERYYLELEQRVDRVQTICRPLSLSRVTIALDLLFEDRRDEWARMMSEGDCELELLPPKERSVASFDVERLGHAFDAFVAWRAGGEAPGRAVRLRWWVDAGWVHVSWEESPAGSELSAGSGPATGSTWTLPLLARILQAHGGDYRLIADQQWQLLASWPCSLPSP